MITALLIVAMVSIAAVAMASRQYLDIRRTANILHTDQAYLYANAAEVFAKQVLIHGDDDMEKDSRDEPWATPLPPTPVEGGSIGGVLLDVNGNFPLNMLVDDEGRISQAYLEVLRRLLDNLGIKNLAIADNIANWLDKDDEPQRGGLEDLDYLNLPRPYRTANSPMVSLSELRLIAGFDEKGQDMARLLGKPIPQDPDLPETETLLPPRGEPYVNVLPRLAGEKIAINVNTASKELIMSLHKIISAEVADMVVARQVKNEFDETADGPFSNREGFINFLMDKLELPSAPTGNNSRREEGRVYRDDFQRDLTDIVLAGKSDYFEMTATAQIGDSQMVMKSLLRRKTDAQGGKATVATIRRGLGEY